MDTISSCLSPEIISKCTFSPARNFIIYSLKLLSPHPEIALLQNPAQLPYLLVLGLNNHEEYLLLSFQMQDIEVSNATDIRVPLTIGSPLRISGSDTIIPSPIFASF